MKSRTVVALTVFCAAGLLCRVQAEPVQAEEGFSYADVANLEFAFSSGAGAWGTGLTIHADGTFEGNYHDTEAGVRAETYPNGTRYVCDFTGQFTEPVKVNDYTYSAQIQDIQYMKEPGTTEIVDGIQNIYSEAYGLDKAENILFYVKGAPLAELPEEYRSWVGYYDLTNTSDTELPFVGLYNEAAQEGFSSYMQAEPVQEGQASSIEEELEKIAQQASVLREKLNQETLSQDDMNRIASELFMLWDDELNSMWSRLKEILPAETMSRLTDEEVAWISEKESAVAAAGAEVAGGSMQPFVENTKAAELTEARVHELAEYFR